MKKALKIAGIVLLALVALLAIGATVIQVRGIPSYEVKAPDMEVKSDSAMVAEGKRLATMVCYQCHLSENRKLEGAFMEDGDFGEIYAPNITQHPDYGIGQYTDGELAYLLRTGIKRNGQFAPPWMPKFPHLSEQDLHSIIAYLRSDEPEVQPSEQQQPTSKPSFLAKMLCNVAFKPLPYPTKTVESPPVTDEVAYGKYLATAKVECYTCHSASFTTVDLLVPEKSGGYFGGGNPVPDKEGNIVHSANLTSNKETGIGNWTEVEFIYALRYGKLPNGNMMRPPMVPYSALTEEEASAIWAYLQSLPPIKNEVKR